jgi:hypothetical protein
MLRQVAILITFLAAGCSGPRATVDTIRIALTVDGETREVSLPPGTSVQGAIEQEGIQIGELDRVTPPSYTVLTDGTSVTVVRIEERFEIDQVTIPFERQTIRNEGLPEGETRLLQPGINGTEEITYRIVLEEGVEVSRQPVKRSRIEEPHPEIVMIGAQALSTPVAIEGTIVYLSSGNAWVIRGNSASRRPLVFTGDLDGRIFKLSPDSRWLLYSRSAEEESEEINSLWVVSTIDFEPGPLPMSIRNVIHFADWSPDQPSFTFAYSTVEPRPSAPGWQANNDLYLATFSPSTGSVRKRELIPPNAGGQYGWWGTSFTWAQDGLRMAFARADGIGVIDLRDPAFEILHPIIPFQTRADWAWVPGVAWGPDNRTLYAVDHGPPIGLEEPGASPVFDLIALLSLSEQFIQMEERIGMFSHPSVSSPTVVASGEIQSRIALLRAISPLESDASSYRLHVLDRDGSNGTDVFPAVGEPGIAIEDLVQPKWSPNADRVALIYRGDLWVVDLMTGIGQRLTGDSQVSQLDWKP